MFSEQAIWEFFSQYAYRPMWVYSGIVLFMTASSFGFPVPEEVVLVSAGLVAYMAMNPAEFPPPFEGAVGVDLTVLAIVCFIAVICSDVLIYFIGRFFGEKLVKTEFFKKRVGQERFDKIHSWFHKYSAWACGIFRFTPGIRFPGHMTCGMLKIPLWKFIAVDGSAALLSVPTQVLLVAAYGEVILAKLKEFKLILFSMIGLAVLFFFLKKILDKRKAKSIS